MSAVFTVARVTALRALRRPSTWALSALAFLPAAIGVVTGIKNMGVAQTVGPIAVKVIAPLLVVSLVASPVGEDFERRTVVYWFMRPVPRPAVLFGILVGNAAIGAAVLALAGSLLAVANAIFANGELASLARIPLGLALTGATLASFTVGVGALFPKFPVAATLGALFATELALPRLWAPLHYASALWHASALCGLGAGDEQSVVGTVQPPSTVVSLVALAVFALLPFALASRAVSDRDLA